MMNPSRRLFLRNLGALAALAVVPSSLKALAPDDHARLMAMLESGLVENQTFVLTRPITIDMPGLSLVVRNCVFRAEYAGDESMFEVLNTSSFLMENCLLGGANVGVKLAV